MRPADPTGELWSVVLDHAKTLHPDDNNPFDEHMPFEHNGSRPWGYGDISDEIADIHFTAAIAFLLKPSGDLDET